VLGVAAVGAATHLVIWMRSYLRGNYGRHRAVRRFALYSLVLHALAFGAGNVMYPTYRVEVRAAHLENAGLLTEEHVARERALDALAEREGQPPYARTPARGEVARAAKLARWFDVKEHWIALGLFASLGLVLVLRFWDPRRGHAALAPVVMTLAVVVAGTVWIGAIIGVLVTSMRAI
jgi:hypothetical protein